MAKDYDVYEANFQNYFGIGGDAQVTVAVEEKRNAPCGRCTFRCGIGKMWYRFSYFCGGFVWGRGGASFVCCNVV